MKGFSLIELIVVIAIVALLAAIAVPSYAAYRVKAKVTMAYRAIQDVQNSLVKAYDSTGSWPASVQFFGFTIADGASVDISSNTAAAQLGFTTISYNRGGGFGASARGVYLQPYLSNAVIGFPSGGPNSIKLGLRADTNGVIRSYCGIWSTTNNGLNDIPSQYMPSTCSCINMGNIASSDTAPTGC